MKHIAMTVTAGALGLLAACAPEQTPGPLALTPGSAEYEVRQQQLRSAQATPGTRSGVTVGIGEQGNAGPQFTGGGSGSLAQPGMVRQWSSLDEFTYVPADQASQYLRRPRAAGASGPTPQQVVEFSRRLDRAEQAIASGRLSAASQEIARAETMVWRARTETQTYEAALRDLAAARGAANRGDGGAALAAINAIKSRMRAAS